MPALSLRECIIEVSLVYFAEVQFSGQTNLNASFVEQIDSTMFGTTYSHSIAIGGKKEMNQIMAALHLYVVIFLFHPI